MLRKLKVGIVGFGQMGTHHARVYGKIPMVELAAISELDRRRCEEAETEFKCRTYTDYHDLLRDPEIDAVSIVLPDNKHRDCVEEAVKNKKHIFLEKPLAKDLADGEAMYRILKDYDRVFTVGFLLRFDPRFAAIKESLE